MMDCSFETVAVLQMWQQQNKKAIEERAPLH